MHRFYNLPSLTHLSFIWILFSLFFYNLALCTQTQCNMKVHIVFKHTFERRKISHTGQIISVLFFLFMHVFMTQRRQILHKNSLKNPRNHILNMSFLSIVSISIKTCCFFVVAFIHNNRNFLKNYFKEIVSRLILIKKL